ncbi:hypothetical protein HORIV_67600 [Vreelandella olivaria]|uniref:TRAP C4-dicarboxylate transport system permease DctM subunit domain-containing protein n=1 Tax=Vreelandella olivaria TaxID=390919 RepID=A0ABN5X503_9GAMM|nr:hypothetical protein HORIV_67600 [Halomonas olivaria]
MAVNYAMLVSLFVYRDLNLPQIYKLLIRSAMTTAVIMLVIAMSAVLSWTLSSWQVPGAIAQAVLSLSTNPYVIMLLIVGIILLTGVFIETASALIILTPVLLPLVLQLGIDPIHFGLIIVVGLSIGMITPPVAINLYVASSITQLPLERITRAIIPYLLGLIGVLLLVVYVPIMLGWSGVNSASRLVQLSKLSGRHFEELIKTVPEVRNTDKTCCNSHLGYRLIGLL